MLLKTLVNILFPPLCLTCKKHIQGDDVICRNCYGKISLNQTLFCGKCGARLANQKRICHLDFPYLLGAAGSYGDETLKSLIHSLKFRYIKSAARPLGEILICYTETLNLPLEKFSVIPVPLSERRLRERGFNQAELIAKTFAGRFGLPLITSALRRSKHAKPQSETKNLSERQRNVLGCFLASRSDPLRRSASDARAVAGKNILLIDDVTTSGATLFEAATALKNAGARKIIALVAAKT